MTKLRELIDRLRDGRLAAYQASPGDIKEHYGIEQTVLAGGYGYRQVLELVQNGADAILEAHTAGAPNLENSKIDVLISHSSLYVANTGAPLSDEGIDALLRSHSSPKRANQIGRFGLGFKSLLKLGGRIDLFSTGVAMRFEPDRCRQELREKFGFANAPGLRLAWTLDEERERLVDPNLDRFAWATTVVRAEVRDVEHLKHLHQEIQGFPSEFLLFLPIPVTVTLDAFSDRQRIIRREMAGADTLLHDGDEVSRWRVVERSVSITDDRARQDATHIHARESSVPISWAVPLDATREEAGRFWAFFPTGTPTRLPGILNAPWKLNSDRNAIIGGEWNTALMTEAASLVAQSLPGLATVEDPARPLDSFPRQMERQDETAAPLVNALWKAIEGSPSIPNTKSAFCYPRSLWRHPRDLTELACAWAALASKEAEILVHPACLNRDRNSRLAELQRRLERSIPEDSPRPKIPNLAKRDATLWFNAVASLDGKVALQLLKLVNSYEDNCASHEWHVIRPTLQIIPSEDGDLHKPANVIIAPDGVVIPGRSRVLPFLRDEPDAFRILTEVLKVHQLDDKSWRDLLEEAFAKIELKISAAHFEGAARSAEDEWRTLWSRLRMAPAAVRDQFINVNRNRIRVRRRDGIWALSDQVLLPGVLVAVTDTEIKNQNVLLDDQAHVHDASVVKLLGVTDCPRGIRGPGCYDVIVGENENDLWNWLCERRSDFLRNASSRPYSNYLEPFKLSMPLGWPLLALLTGAPNAKFTGQLLTLALAQNPEFKKPVKFGHSTRPDAYPKLDVAHPLFRFLLQHGSILIGNTAIPLSSIIARRQESVMVLLRGWPEMRLVLAELAEIVKELRTPGQKDLIAFWNAMFAHLATPSALAQDSLMNLWASAARDNVVPDSLDGTLGRVPLTKVYVTTSADLARRARRQDRLVITLDENALSLWRKAGARSLDQLFKPSWTEILGPPDRLVFAIPELATVLRQEITVAARCQSFSGLSITFDDTADPLPCLMWENALLLDSAQLAQLSRAERLRLLVNEVAAAGWLQYEPAEALRRLGDAQLDERRAHVARGVSLPDRLLRAVGARAEPLRRSLGDLATLDFIQKCNSIQLAELTLAQFGPATLSILKDTLENEGLKPPSRWNTAEARAFVASIGFPDEFAASLESRRDPEEFISGPIELPPLHDFQEEVLAGVRDLVASTTTRRRAVVSLPTGGGKTRVTVEAAVLLVLRPVGDRRSVVWVAQTDELCEQAVQAFRQVWINLGAQKTDLRIVRLWGGNSNPSIQELDKPVVVVASIQTLNSRMGTDGLGWLNKPGLVVVDECHHAITPSYTNLLRWLDAEAPRSDAPPREEPPILGLSATPFRTDDDESRRLAKRFDNRWLPANQKELHARLLEKGVLAKAIHEALQSGIGLSDGEINQLARIDWEGLDFEKLLEEINQRLGKDKTRNERLVARIENAEERSILFFANSVQHAEEISARLNLRGIPAAAVSGSTATSARRYFLQRFLVGEIRILCNHSVLSTGFDAPKTDMILIARQVFSPVRYMQMVGRGLRGLKNGGTAQCRIVTVMDNLGRFADRHPYHFCAEYFSGTII